MKGSMAIINIDIPDRKWLARQVRRALRDMDEALLDLDVSGDLFGGLGEFSYGVTGRTHAVVLMASAEYIDAKWRVTYSVYFMDKIRCLTYRRKRAIDTMHAIMQDMYEMKET